MKKLKEVAAAGRSGARGMGEARGEARPQTSEGFACSRAPPGARRAELQRLPRDLPRDRLSLQSAGRERTTRSELMMKMLVEHLRLFVRGKLEVEVWASSAVRRGRCEETRRRTHGWRARLQPDELLYDVENHIWYRELPDGNVKLGMTAVATAMAGQLVAYTRRRSGAGSTRASPAPRWSREMGRTGEVRGRGHGRRGERRARRETGARQRGPLRRRLAGGLKPADWAEVKATLTPGSQVAPKYEPRWPPTALPAARRPP